MNLKISTLLISTLILIILSSNIVFADFWPPQPFKGFVTINGNPAPDGTTVTAKIDGEEFSTTTKDGKYGYPIGTFSIPDTDPPSRGGKTINFFVNGVDTGQTETFIIGIPTRLDLTVTIEGEQPTPQQSPPGGGTFILPGEELGEEEEGEGAPPACTEDWNCTPWSECTEGLQTRTCTDLNNCGTYLNKPPESQPCSLEEIKEGEVTGGLTGFFLLSSTEWAIGLISGVVIALIIIFLLIRKRKKKR